MKRRVTVTEGKSQEVAGVHAGTGSQINALRIEVRRKPRHKRQFVVVIEVAERSRVAPAAEISAAAHGAKNN